MSTEAKKGLFRTISSSPPVQITKNGLLYFLSFFNKPIQKILWNIGILVVFSFLYFILIKVKDGDNDEERSLTLEEAIYFTFTVHFTVGFGDFSPSNRVGKIIYMFHIFFVWIVNMVPSGLLDNMNSETNVTNKYQLAPETNNNAGEMLNRTLTTSLDRNKERRMSLLN